MNPTETQSKSDLHFNEDAHIYVVDGEKKKSITDVLKEFKFYPYLQFATDEDMWRGQQIHKALEFYHKGTLNQSTLDPLIRPFLGAWRLFESETGFQAWGWEIPMYDPLSNRCGRCDVWGEAGNEIWVIDYKSGGVGGATRLQLAGYQVLLQRCGLIPLHGKTIKRKAVQLKSTGTYNVKPFNDPNDITAWCKLNDTYNWREENA